MKQLILGGVMGAGIVIYVVGLTLLASVLR